MIRIPEGKEKVLGGIDFIDLFAGIGGFHFAMTSFGARCVFSSEINVEAQDTYEANHGVRPFGDITQRIHVDSIPKHDVICGGFPCQAFSISGKREGFNDIRGTLFFEIARIAEHHKPKLIFMENVENFAKHDNGNTLKVVRQELVRLGYDCYSEVLCAGDFGVPQARNRVFMLAIRKDLGFPGWPGKTFRFPEPIFDKVYLKDILLPNDQTEKYIRHNLKNIDMRDDREPSLALNPIQIGTVGSGRFGLNGRQGERIYHPNGHSITLTAAGGGPGKSTGLYKINGSIRNLAPMECARLMGMPAGFKLNEKERAAYRQAGNGVVVDVLQHIILSIVNQIRL